MLRVSTKMLYTQSVGYINNTLTKLTELNEQASSQKRVNKPSDDPTGTATILNLRTTLSAYDQYTENASTAKSWLSGSDSTLLQVSALLSKLKGLAQQASNDPMSADNLTQIAYEARQYYEQLVALANTKYQGMSLYGGQDTDGDAFNECLWMTTNNATLSASNSFSISGDSKITVLVKFVNSNVSGNGTALMSDSDVMYSIDGGRTYLDGSITSNGSGQLTLNLPESGTSLTFAHDSTINISATSNSSYNAGTWLWIRPTAVYNGDDADASSTTVNGMGAGTKLVAGTARGSFSGNTIVRIDNDSPVAMNGEIKYSYSLDNGLTWVTGNTAAADTTSNSSTLDVATGGLLTLTPNGSNLLQPGAQFVISPATAGVSLRVSPSEVVQVNDVGKDIFGGVYQSASAVLSNGGARLSVNSSNTSTVFSSLSTLYTSNGGTATKNMFETVGNLVAFLETNNKDGVAQCLESLKLAQTQITTAVASVGGRENRIATTQTILTNLTGSVTTQLSSVEDVDITKLLTALSQQETAYEAVLKSSSLVISKSLMDYL
ncbi:MAG: flagellar hook-associated protein 3 [Desulfovibrionaceae bacterium CG1_02_65_16]|nr:MAG: flagellar hook-associated protein 3 [Desulfovibrionaceae bacterium CG1_02_65_16]